MINLYEPKIIKVTKVVSLTKNIKRFTLNFLHQIDVRDFFFLPGQFFLFGLWGMGEIPLSICSTQDQYKNLEIVVKKTGTLTNKIHQLKSGDQLTIRGPFGRGLPDWQNKKSLLIVQGIEIVNLKSLILNLVKNRQTKFTNLIYLRNNQDDFLFSKEILKWQKAGLNILNHYDEPEVSLLSKEAEIIVLAVPPQINQKILSMLDKLSIASDKVYVFAERKMCCGIGICQHCAIGSKYVCKDGPFFKWSEIKNNF